MAKNKAARKSAAKKTVAPETEEPKTSPAPKAPAAPPADPLAGKSADEVKAELDAARKADEAAKAQAPKPTMGDKRAARHAARMKEYAAHAKRKARGLIVDESVKAEALEVLADLAKADADVAAARARSVEADAGDAEREVVIAARAARAEAKRAYSALYGKSADSVEAAEAIAAK